MNSNFEGKAEVVTFFCFGDDQVGERLLIPFSDAGIQFESTLIWLHRYFLGNIDLDDETLCEGMGTIGRRYSPGPSMNIAYSMAIIIIMGN